MLTLILGRAKTGKTQKILQMVKDCPAEGMAQRILIVPEQMNHQMERKLCEVCGNSISYTAEVLSFTKLSSRVFAVHGGGARQNLDKGGRILTVRLALDSIHSQLKVFASAAGKADFLSSVVDMIDEFKTYDITPLRLMEASRQTEGMFAEKLRELSLILGAYDAVIARGACDPRDKLTLLKQTLEEYDFADNRYFFLDGFTDFSGQEQEILRVLMKKSRGVAVSLLCDDPLHGDSVFAPARATAAMLIRMAKNSGVSVEILYAQHEREIPEEFTYIENNLFSYQTPAFQGRASAVSLGCAKSRLEECRHCAAVLRDAAISGIRWRDMYIAASDISSYGTTLEAICREYQIPLYTGIKTPVTSHPAAAFVLCALEAAADGMEQETVMAYLRTGFSGVSRDDCDCLENYVYTWRIRGSKWQNKWSEHPEGYDGRYTEATEQELVVLNEIRQRAVQPLVNLMTGLKNAGNVRTQVKCVYEFLEDTRLYDQVNDRITRLTEQGYLEEAQEEAQIFNTLLECLQQMVSVLGQTAQNSGEFLRTLKLALDQYSLDTIPATLDSVNFGDISSVRGMEPDLLYILGVNEGLVPGTPSGKSLLTERERGILLSEMDIALAPDQEGVLQRELLWIYGAFTAPKQRLYASWLSSDSGETKQPSYIAQRLCNMFPDQYREITPQAGAVTPETLAELYFSAVDTGENALAEVIRRTVAQFPDVEQKLVDARAAILPREMNVTRDLSSRLFGAPVALTASRLDSLGNCPLSFFLNYGLKARERKEATFDAAEFGTFLHYILEQTVGTIAKGDTIEPLTPEESAALVSEHMKPYLDTRMQDPGELSSREQYLYDRNRNEVSDLLVEISKEFAVSQFRPCAFELQFGSGKELPSLEVSGKHGSGHLDGMVDRADLWKGEDGNYLRIVDYKSGTKSFDYTDLAGGVGMQMLLYLFALSKAGAFESGKLLPAGVLYFPAKRRIIGTSEPVSEEAVEKLRKKSGTKPTGVVLADETVLNAMEQGIEGQYIPVSKGKNGYGEFAVTPQQMSLLEAFVEKRMGQAVDQITDGKFEPKPFYRGQSHDPCRWCEYGAVCQKDAKFRKEHYVPKLSASEFWDLIGGDEDA